MSAIAQSTYQAVAELERAGVSRSTAFEQIAEREGVSKGAVSQRYYIARKRENGHAPARARKKPTGEPLPTVAEVLAETAGILRDLIPMMRAVERDAARWRALRASLDE